MTDYTNRIVSLNSAAWQLCQLTEVHQRQLKIAVNHSACGTKLIDFGVKHSGGIHAGLLLAKICLADQADVQCLPSNSSDLLYPIVQVITDAPVAACMASQYAGWPIQKDDFFAMGSGPMRVKRGKEHVLESLRFADNDVCAVGVLECDAMPSESVCRAIAQEIQVEPDQLCLCIAPTRSIAGCIQVVARSVETSLHKMFELGFDLDRIVSATGTAPLPPPALKFAEGIGRTNDAILYGGKVFLWVDCEDDCITQIGDKIPSCASRDWGRPFASIFKQYDFDFYKVDPGLFSPAMITISNLRSGRSWQFGKLRFDVIQQSFETQGI